MSGKVEKKVVDRSAVDWSKANCRGLNTDFFFMEEDLLKNKAMAHKQIRKICFRCPIRQQCLEVGFAFERYGMWGGVASLERHDIVKGNYDSRILSPLFKDLEEFGVPFEEIVEASNVERDLM
jgi:hypothetical protein